ncbi:MAG TPA: phospholipase, partial [Methylophaga sp.]|nr:phospholipase [Methylophaga sp.]
MKLFIADKPTQRRHLGLWLLTLLIVVLVGMGFYHVYKPLPPGLDIFASERSATDVQFLADRTFTSTDGER